MMLSYVTKFLAFIYFIIMLSPACSISPEKDNWEWRKSLNFSYKGFSYDADQLHQDMANREKTIAQNLKSVHNNSNNSSSPNVVLAHLTLIISPKDSDVKKIEFRTLPITSMGPESYVNPDYSSTASPEAHPLIFFSGTKGPQFEKNFQERDKINCFPNKMLPEKEKEELYRTILDRYKQNSDTLTINNIGEDIFDELLNSHSTLKLLRSIKKSTGLDSTYQEGCENLEKLGWKKIIKTKDPSSGYTYAPINVKIIKTAISTFETITRGLKEDLTETTREDFQISAFEERLTKIIPLLRELLQCREKLSEAGRTFQGLVDSEQHLLWYLEENIESLLHKMYMQNPELNQYNVEAAVLHLHSRRDICSICSASLCRECERKDSKSIAYKLKEYFNKKNQDIKTSFKFAILASSREKLTKPDRRVVNIANQDKPVKLEELSEEISFVVKAMED